MTAHLVGATTRHCAAHRDYTAGCEGCRATTRRYRKHLELRQIRGQAAEVDSTGTARRLQALAWMGWTTRELAARLGRRQQQVAAWTYQQRPVVFASTADVVAALFSELCMTPGGNNRAHLRAVRNGWASPLAWDDIDHDARPNFDGSEGGPPRADVDAVVRLTRAGRSATEIAVALGVSRRTVVRVRARVKETAA